MENEVRNIESVFKHTVLDPATFWGAVAYAILFLLIAILLAYLLGMATGRVVERGRAGLFDHTAVAFLGRLGQILIFIIAFGLYAHLIPELRSLGTALLASVSVASIVIGLAAQQTLGNLVAGISLLIYRPFRAGEWIEVTTPNGVESGFVEDLTLGYTILHTLDKRRIVVPNSLFTNQITVNQSMRDPEVTVNVTLPVIHATDTDRACAVLRGIGEADPLVHEVVDSRVAEITTQGTMLLLRVRCAGTIEGRLITFGVLEAARERFAAEGIEMAYSYRNHPPKNEREVLGGEAKHDLSTSSDLPAATSSTDDR